MAEADKACRKCGQPTDLVHYGALVWYCTKCRFRKACRGCHKTIPDVTFGTPNAVRCMACTGERRRELARTRPDRKGVRRRPYMHQPKLPSSPRSCLKHAAWVRSLPCCIGHPNCRGLKMHAHHVRERSGGGMGMRPGDEWCVPLCILHHTEGHTGGWKTFESRYGVNLRGIAESLARTSPYLSADSVDAGVALAYANGP